MSNLVPSVIPLQDGLDLQSPKLIAKPGSMIDCLNYEIVDLLGYKRIDGFQRYDGNVSLKDIPNARVYTAAVTGVGTLGAGITNEAFEDSFGNTIGFIFSAVPISGGPNATITYISFSGDLVASGTMATTLWSFTSSATAHSETTQTQDQMIALETYLRNLVVSLPRTPVGLHWFIDKLYAVVPISDGSDQCTLWYAARPATYTSISKLFSVSGWFNNGVVDSFTLTVTLTTSPAAAPELNTIRKNNTTAESTYYFASGAGVIEAVVLDYFILSGSFAAGDAVLLLQVSDLSVESGAPGLIIDTTFELTTDAAGLMDIGDVTVTMAQNYLPGLPSLTEHNSRYEFKTANFYASDDMTQMYGVSGAGRAFAFDGRYLSFIYTQEDEDLDKPRHLANHALHLALGFQQGSVQLSVVGEPTNFDGATGASDIGVGDRVTGLMELEGTTLAVFCEQSIWAVAGTSVDNFQLQVIAPNTGCIEYSLANCGFPVYLDNRGISTLQTSARYGDFVGERLSAPVSPWLVPRCKTSLLAINNSAGISCALPIRHKNQYRLFFNDGRILTMTFMVGTEANSVGFTFQTYYLEQPTITDTLYRLVPICGTSEIDREGVERTYVAHYNADSPVESDHVYGLDSGISFDGKYIPHYFDTNWYFGEAPIQYMGIQKLRLHGLSRGYTKLDIYAAGVQNDYSFGGNVFSTTAEPINLPRTPGNIYNELLPVTNIANLANRGIGIQLRFKGQNTDLTKPEPTHIAQVMVVYSRPGGGDDA